MLVMQISPFCVTHFDNVLAFRHFWEETRFAFWSLFLCSWLAHQCIDSYGKRSYCWSYHSGCWSWFYHVLRYYFDFWLLRDGTLTHWHCLVFVVITDVAPVDWRPRLQSVLVIVYGLASVVGPLLGK